MLSVEGSLASRDAVGGTAPVRVPEQLELPRERVAAGAPVRLTRIRRTGAAATSSPKGSRRRRFVPRV